MIRLKSDLINAGRHARLNRIDERLAQEGDVARMAKLFIITGANSMGNSTVVLSARAR
jgi:hypothetical protein